MVISLFPGQAAEEVERQVTLPVERALVGVPNVLIQRSITSFGLSQVILTFEDGVDIYFARQQVAERLPEAEVPQGVEPHLGPNDTPVGQIFQYTLESDHHDPSELRSWQDWVVSKRMMRAPGVADVVSFGGFQKEYHVLADADRLRSNGLTLDELIRAVSSSNGARSGGYLRRGESELVVRGRGYLRGPADIEQTVVRARNGTPILVRNVARVVEAYTPRRGSVGRNDAVESVEGTVLLRRGENPRTVLAGLHEVVDEINGELPAGMRIVTLYDRTRLVDTTLKTVSHNMLEGIVLVSAVIWLFLRAVVGSFAVSLTMPLALLAAFVGLYYAGVPANLLSMGAIDFGILLEGAVILVENAYRRLAQERPPPESVPHVVAEAAKEVVRPTLFSMAIIGAAMMPIFTLERVEGRIFRPVALTYAFALGGALLFTLTCVPAVTAALLKHRPVREVEPAFLHWLRSGYQRALRGHAAVAGCDGAVVAAADRRGADLDDAPRVGVPADHERGRHPHHRHDAVGDLARERRRDPARDPPGAADLPRGQRRADRAGTPGRRHRRRGAQPGRDVRHHAAAERMADRAQQRAGGDRHARRCSSVAPASSSTSASRSRTAWRSRSPASAARSWSRSTAKTWGSCSRSCSR